MHPIYEELEAKGLVRKNNINEESIRRIEFCKALDLLESIAQRTSYLTRPKYESIFDYTASIALGAGRSECFSIFCRMRKADQLARFAALYSDHVIIHNFLADHSSIHGHTPKKDNINFRMRLKDDIKIVLHLKPLIEAGIIIPFTPKMHCCPACLAKIVFGKDADKRYKATRRRLVRLFRKNTLLEFRRDSEKSYVFLCHLPDELSEHRMTIIPLYFRGKLFKNIITQEMKNIAVGDIIKVPKYICDKIKLDKMLAGEIFHDIFYHLSVSEVIGNSFLTARQLDIDFLDELSDNPEFVHRNAISVNHLQTVVPFAGDIPVSKLLTLRKRENASFIEFRKAIGEAISQLQNEKNKITSLKAKELYSDIILPELARLDNKIKGAKIDLIRNSLSTAAVTTAAIGFGIYSGMIQPEILCAAKALGLTKVCYDTAKSILNLADIKKAIRPEKYYFLWKVSKLAEHYGKE